MALSNVLAPGQRRDRAACGVGQHRMRHALLGRRPGADQTILRLEEHMDVVRQKVRHERRNTDAQIDQHAGFKLTSDAACDDGLRVHLALSY